MQWVPLGIFRDLGIRKVAKLLRCYGRPVIGWTEAKQRDLFAQHGVKSRDGAPIYFDTAGTFPRQRKAAIASLRVGSKDEFGVARLYVLASNRRDLREVLADIKSKGATIRELLFRAV